MDQKNYIVSVCIGDFLLKETTGAFDGAWTNDWQVSTDYESDMQPTVPRQRGASIKNKYTRVTDYFTYIYLHHNNIFTIKQRSVRTNIG